MRVFKRSASAILALVMVLCLTGCGGNKIAGKWESEVDISGVIINAADAGLEGVGVSLGDYLDNIMVKYISEFDEDGACRQYLDEESLLASMKEIKAAYRAFNLELVKLMTIEMYREIGGEEEINTDEDFENIMGAGVEEAFEKFVGMDIDSYVDTQMDETEMIKVLEENFYAEGRYEASKGKLYLSPGLEYDFKPDVYETYTLKGDVLTITGGAGENGEADYPKVLNRIG